MDDREGVRSSPTRWRTSLIGSLRDRQRALRLPAIPDHHLNVHRLPIWAGIAAPCSEETSPMARADWRSASAYEELRPLDAPGFAFEFLRRNPDFLRDHARLARKSRGRLLDPADADAFAQHWGVQFRSRITYTPSRWGPMDAPRPSNCRRPDEGAGRAGNSVICVDRAAPEASRRARNFERDLCVGRALPRP